MAPMQSAPSTTGLAVRVHAYRQVAQGIVAIELRATEGGELPPFTAGSHIDVQLPVSDAHGHAMVRQYSLCNDPAERQRYVIGVGRDANSRGGSAWLHDTAQVGDIAKSGNDTSEPISLDMEPALDSSDTADPVPVS